MEVKVKFFGIFRHVAGKEETSVSLEADADLLKLVDELDCLCDGKFKDLVVDPSIGTPRPEALILIDGIDFRNLCGMHTPLKDTKYPIVFIPFTGGGR